jgi:alkanesulfonate monooxygenase SsuD/methylene tetrahydromethanopterin reductase-like flavin-dependent oxidoreductase (luciferase family)
MGFAFAHHFASYDAIAAMTNYRDHFKPSGWRATPHGILAVAAVAAETDAEAEQLASSMDLNRCAATADNISVAECRGSAGL